MRKAMTHDVRRDSVTHRRRVLVYGLHAGGEVDPLCARYEWIRKSKAKAKGKKSEMKQSLGLGLLILLLPFDSLSVGDNVMNSLWKETRYAMRKLMKRQVALMALAIGRHGANTHFQYREWSYCGRCFSEPTGVWYGQI